MIYGEFTEGRAAMWSIDCMTNLHPVLMLRSHLGIKLFHLSMYSNTPRSYTQLCSHTLLKKKLKACKHIANLATLKPRNRLGTVFCPPQ